MTEREEEITLHAAAEDAIHTYQNELSNNKDQSRELTRSTNRNGDTVIGNKEFRYIADKKYISGLDHATANILIEKLNEIGLDLSSSFRADGTATVTVSGDEIHWKRILSSFLMLQTGLMRSLMHLTRRA